MKHIAIIGGGFTGLAAGYDLSKKGFKVTIIEKDTEIGGLAGSFDVNGVKLEKFYHHWFANDYEIIKLVTELGKLDEVENHKSKTGLYYSKSIFKLSTPMDLLKFTAISLPNRIRLGLFILTARLIKDWKKLENQTAYEWIRKGAGKQAFEIIWKPLLDGKFGSFAPEISAVWMWSKFKLRGGSRNQNGDEILAYYKGGFARLAEHLADSIKENGGEFLMGEEALRFNIKGSKITSIVTSKREIEVDACLVASPLRDYMRIVDGVVPTEYMERLSKIPFLANTCLVLQLDRSLSDTYWLNINDPNFPFVGIIEHTNFEAPETYKGSHIVYLSKYLPEDTAMYKMDKDELLSFALPHITRMFPDFKKEWIRDFHVWKAQYSQPVVVRNYSQVIPQFNTPFENLFLSTMAQIYPEDRGTNYAIKHGRMAASKMTDVLK
jgi:protoporphyrinogen oxidase